MTGSITEHLARAPIVPLIQADDPDKAVATAAALVSAGLSVIEVVLRTDNALACLQEISHRVPEAVVGAGTVLTAIQANEATHSGARFIVSPGLDESVIDVARNANLSVFPGIATASELQQAYNLGIDIVKFFPASLNGGTAMLRALGSVFRGVRFIPTGGVNANDLAEYLTLPSVLACGGSWLTPKPLINADDFDAVKLLAKEAIAIADVTRSR